MILFKWFFVDRIAICENNTKILILNLKCEFCYSNLNLYDGDDIVNMSQISKSQCLQIVFQESLLTRFELVIWNFYCLQSNSAFYLN